jgi:peptidoglycan L-alanyl-D-glutamate endopeptidase CwlK
MKRDQITLDRIRLMHPKVRDEVYSVYDEVCEALSGRSMCRFTRTLATIAEQNALFAQGRTKPGPIVTKARGGLSYHNYGVALDIVLIRDLDGNGTYEKATWDITTDFDGDGKADWMEVVQIFKEHGWEWGGDWGFKDPPHFQKTFGYSVRQLLDLMNRKKVDANNYVII